MNIGLDSLEDLTYACVVHIPERNGGTLKMVYRVKAQ